MFQRMTTEGWQAPSTGHDSDIHDRTSNARSLETPGAFDWQGRAIATYQEEQYQRMIELCARLVNEIGRLTGQTITSDSIIVDRDAGYAQIVLDGVRFQQCRQGLVLLRACESCGNGQYGSTLISTVSDLGYALVGWHPECNTCASTKARRRLR